MTPESLIIEDFDFCQYPITRIYPLGNKTVIQIGEVSFGKSRSELLDEIDDLNKGISGLEDDLRDKESSIDDLESDKAKLLDDVDAALSCLEDQFDFVPEYSKTIALNIIDLRQFLNNKARSDAEWEELEEKIGGLELDNRALASTVAEQDKTIAELIKQLAAQKTKNETILP